MSCLYKSYIDENKFPDFYHELIQYKVVYRTDEERALARMSRSALIGWLLVYLIVLLMCEARSSLI